MQIPSSKRRNLVLYAVVVVVLYTILFLQNVTNDDLRVNGQLSEAQRNAEGILGKHNACVSVKFDTLASDVVFHSNGPPRSLFLNQDGTPTLDDVFINEDESMCIVVLLEPIAQHDPVDDRDRMDADDIIIMHAVGKYTQFMVHLQQHDTHHHIYYAPVHFAHADVYRLQSRLEHRTSLTNFIPVTFVSDNTLRVRPDPMLEKQLLPACNLQNHAHHPGAWMSKAEYQRMYPLDFYGMFEKAQEDHAVNGRLFVPNRCRAQYVSIGQAAQCLFEKTIHVWGDNNIRRNLKAFSTANRWCNSNSDLCICNDDHEDPEHTKYPWAVDSNVPLPVNNTWHANTTIYFNHIGSLVRDNWRKQIRERVTEIGPADVVIIGMGNTDIGESTVTIHQFQISVDEILSHMIEDIYPTQQIIVRTPQPFFTGSIGNPMWTAGRSTAFVDVVRKAVQKLNHQRVYLWDIHQLGLTDNTCAAAGTVYSTRNVVQIENILLWNILCFDH